MKAKTVPLIQGTTGVVLPKHPKQPPTPFFKGELVVIPKGTCCGSQ